MGNSERLFADSGGLTGSDVEKLANDGLALPPGTSAPIAGFIWCHGQTIQFTLDTSHLLPEPRGVIIEQVVIAALLVASFIGSIYHLLNGII